MDLSDAVWRKSTRSGSNGGACIEAAANDGHSVAIRDGEHAAGPVLAVKPAAWTAFTRTLRTR